jgi:anti-sigma-K factor RskA
MTAQHDRYEQDVAAFLLGALDEDEPRELERHLDDCAHCRAELERLRVAADALPRSVMQVNPPPSLKASLMAVVEGEPSAHVQPRARKRLRGALPALGRMRPAVAWVSASFLLAVGIACGWGITQLTEDDSRVIAAQVDAERVPSGSASLVVPEGDDVAVLRVAGMPSLLSDATYQVWLKRDGHVVSQGLFTVGEDGRGSAAVPEALDDADAVLVTREAAGGARAPTEDPILSVEL